PVCRRSRQAPYAERADRRPGRRLDGAARGRRPSACELLSLANGRSRVPRESRAVSRSVHELLEVSGYRRTTALLSAGPRGVRRPRAARDDGRHYRRHRDVGVAADSGIRRTDCAGRQPGAYLFDTAPTDPATFVAVAVSFVLAAAVACAGTRMAGDDRRSGPAPAHRSRHQLASSGSSSAGDGAGPGTAGAAANGLRTCFVDRDPTAIELRLVQSVDRVFRTFLGLHLHECKSTGTPGHLIAHDVDGVHRTNRLKDFFETAFIGVE